MPGVYLDPRRAPLAECIVEDEAEHVWRWFGWGPGRSASKFRDAQLSGGLCKANPPEPRPLKYHGVQCCRLRGHAGIHIAGQVGDQRTCTMYVVARWVDVT